MGPTCQPIFLSSLSSLCFFSLYLCEPPARGSRWRSVADGARLLPAAAHSPPISSGSAASGRALCPPQWTSAAAPGTQTTGDTAVRAVVEPRRPTAFLACAPALPPLASLAALPLARPDAAKMWPSSSSMEQLWSSSSW